MLKFGILIVSLLLLSQSSLISAQSKQICPAPLFLVWTAWFDRDDTSGYGDYETLIDLRKEGKLICPKPVTVECSTLSGIPAASTGEIVVYNPSVGCYCVNADQPDKRCNYDYRVRFGCCSECPSLNSTSYWTAWFDRDNTSGEGDYETLSELRKQGKPICEKPIGVECSTLTGIPAASTGQIVVFSPSVGCYCVNANQPDKKCNHDYQVRFKCCK